MMYQRGFTIIELFIVILFFILIVSWTVNFYKFTQCDFKSDYKCEVMHGIGLFPSVSFITVWFGTDK